MRISLSDKPTTQTTAGAAARRGMTLVEVMVSFAIITLLTASFLGAQQFSLRQQRRSLLRQHATGLAQYLIDSIRTNSPDTLELASAGREFAINLPPYAYSPTKRGAGLEAQTAWFASGRTKEVWVYTRFNNAATNPGFNRLPAGISGTSATPSRTDFSRLSVTIAVTKHNTRTDAANSAPLSGYDLTISTRDLDDPAAPTATLTGYASGIPTRASFLSR